MCAPARAPAAAEAPTWAYGSVALPATHTPGTAVVPVGQPHARNPAVLSGLHPRHRGIDDADTTGGETLPGTEVQIAAAAEVDQVVGQLAEQQGLVHRGGTRGQDADGFVAHLPAVAVRAMHDAVSPVRREPGYIGQHVAQSGSDQQAARPHGSAVGQRDGEPRIALKGRVGGTRGGYLAGHDLAAVAAYLLAAGAQHGIDVAFHSRERDPDNGPYTRRP